MKNVLRNITSFLLVFILLISTLQLSIYKMECLISGTTKVSLSDFEDCESKSDDNCSIAETCCCFHQMSLDFDFNTNISSNSFTHIPTITSAINIIFTEVITLNIDYNLFTNLPPPSGYDLLKIVQVFRL